MERSDGRRTLEQFGGQRTFHVGAAALLLALVTTVLGRAAEPDGPLPAASAGARESSALQNSASATQARSDEGSLGASGSNGKPVPRLWASLPFALLLLLIAVLPLFPRTEHWWERNLNKLLVALLLGAIALIYYGFRRYGMQIDKHVSAPGWETVRLVVDHAVLEEYVPFIVLLFSLYVISGGIQLTGDLVARPRTNAAFLALGAVLANVIGTTGASMLLIRPLLQTNRERKYVQHTVIFFIFLVSNVGGCLLPIGDPPLFLGYLRGVGFLWTLKLLPQWAICVSALLVIYFVWDSYAYRREEAPRDIARDLAQIERLRLRGTINVLLLLGVVFAVALLVPEKKLLGFTVPPYLRELAQLALAGVSMLVTPRGIRKAVGFNFHAIAEVAALFIGIFLTMQVPVEILRVRGPDLGLIEPWHFFWSTGTLSSVLDNAPTYVVFFETAGSLSHAAGPGVLALQHGFIREDLLAAVSLGSVFMGANSYIGNGPNFMVKSIADRSGVRMPSFFGYLLWSGLILVPLFVLLTVTGALGLHF